MSYAKKSERVTCTNGHTICLIAKDIPWGGLYAPDHFTDWMQPEPGLGIPPSQAPCLRCGALWYGGPDGMRAGVLHFADGWRITPAA